MKYIAIIFLLSSPLILSSQCTHPDFEQLIEFYDAFTGQIWSNNSGWQEGKSGSSCDPCDYNGQPWYGIVCENSRVVKIDFNPTGNATGNRLTGKIFDLKLEKLRTLDLSWNTVFGEIPDFSGLPNLDSLHLGSNGLKDVVPNFSNLPKLKYLNLSQNLLAFSVPNFTNLPLLIELHLEYNNFHWMDDLTNMPNLKILNLKSNQLDVEIQNFSNLPELELLNMSLNHLVGGIPDFDNLPELKHLDLNGNNLTACPNFSSIPKLEYLDLKNNIIESPIPPFENLPLVEILILRGNNFSGEIPSYDDKTQLKVIEISGSNLVGTLPQFLSSSQLQIISIVNTSISGLIPIYDWLPKLEAINVEQNELEGRIPDFKNPMLHTIRLNKNELTGLLPEFKNLPELYQFICTSNDLEGCYPEYFCRISVQASDNLKLPNYGSFYYCEGEDEQIGAPCSSTDNINSLEVIGPDCSCGQSTCTSTHPDFDMLMTLYNATNGENWTNQTGWDRAVAGVTCDPCRQDIKWYGVSCTNGRVSCIDLNGGADTCDPLGIGGNNLMGQLPQLTFDSLKELRLNNNSLFGQLPDINGMPELEILSLAFNQFMGSIPDYSDHENISTLRLTANNLSGELPDVSKWKKLDLLTAAFNDFYGCYPDDICALTEVDFFDNPLLPFDGDVEQFCMGNEQVGAPCYSESNINYTITEDCECAEFLSSTMGSNSMHKLTIYPNPVRDKIYISEIVFNTQYKIYNVQGQIITGGLLLKTNSIDISELPHGLYFISMHNEDQSESSFKFLKD